MKTKHYRTDLIDESEEVVVFQSQRQQKEVEQEEGVVIVEEEDGRIKKTTVSVTESGAQKINKKAGTYITLSSPTMQVDETKLLETLQQHLQQQLAVLHEKLALSKNDKILVIGLGNKTITPDAIGPFTIDALQALDEPTNFILYAPGVTAQTGLETKDFIEALVEKIDPALVIVIDALATRESSRLCRTIQMTDTGIHPGSGVGNERTEVSKETLNVPVTAIGIPTVVDGTVLITDAIDKIFRTIAAKVARHGRPSNRLAVTNWRPRDDEPLNMDVVKPIFGEWSTWSSAKRYQLIEELTMEQERLIVTPKEMDYWLMTYAKLLADALFNWQKSF